MQMLNPTSLIPLGTQSVHCPTTTLLGGGLPPPPIEESVGLVATQAQQLGPLGHWGHLACCQPNRGAAPMLL